MIRPSKISFLLRLCAIASLGALFVSSHAQNRGEITLPTNNTPVEPEIDAPDETVDMLELVDMSAPQVLTLLERMTDKIILRHQSLPATKITFDSRGPLTKREAVLALESLLTLNGVMLTDMGGRFMKAVPAQNVNTHVPQMIGGSTLEMEPSQQIYAKLFKLNYLNAETGAAPLVNNLISSTSSVIPFPKSNALLVTDALINLQRIETVIDEADQAQSVRETIKFIKLNFVQAADMQSRIESLIQGPLNSYLEGNTSVTADERSNQLILITHPGNVDVIMEVIESVDVDAAPLTASEVFQLRQAKAEEVVPIIQEIITGQEEGREEDAKVARENQENNQQPNNRSNNQGNAGSNNPLAPPTVNTPTSAVIAEASSSLQFSNFVGLSADERTNSIVAYGTQQDLKTLRELIEKIDIPLPQVKIEAIITEVSLTENQATGISSFGFTFNNDADGPKLIFGDGGITEEGGNIVEGVGGIFGSGFAFTGNVDGLINAVLRSAESDGDVRIISTPTIVTSHNLEGIVNVSESRPIITSSSSQLDNIGTTRSNVEFRDIGIQLTVTPLIGADGSVQMEIEQTVDNVAGFTTVDGNQQPIIGRREANSTITVKSGEVIILGGLQENRRNDNNSYFPVLGKLPVVKKVFGGDSKEFSRTELIIFIRPTVLTRPEDTAEETNRVIEAMEESRAVKEYLENSNTGRIYMDGSKFENDDNQAPARTKPRSLRR
jgi:general secretion pathway protein D